MEPGDIFSFQRSLELSGQVSLLNNSQKYNLSLLQRSIFTVSDFEILYQHIMSNFLAGHIQQRATMFLKRAD